MKNMTYQIQIALKNFTPKIWRRILINSETSLANFHKIIQTTMGWTNSHLHQFVKGKTNYVNSAGIDDFWTPLSLCNEVNYEKKKTKVSDLLVCEKDRMVYEYDFGDGWGHNIILEKILPPDKNLKHPVCIAGKNNCPPEDCGGVWGYSDMLEILKDPLHEEYEEYLEWMGDDFDPKFFDKEEVNEMLAEKNFGCFQF